MGPLGVGFGWLQYELLWALNPLEEFRGSTTWILSSAVGVAWIHGIHCAYTFRGVRHTSVRTTWWRTLPRAYGLYSGTIALGSLLTWFLIDRMEWPHTAGWVVATAVTSLVNFGFLRSLLSPPTPETR